MACKGIPVARRCYVFYLKTIPRDVTWLMTARHLKWNIIHFDSNLLQCSEAHFADKYPWMLAILLLGQRGMAISSLQKLLLAGHAKGCTESL